MHAKWLRIYCQQVIGQPTMVIVLYLAHMPFMLFLVLLQKQYDVYFFCSIWGINWQWIYFMGMMWKQYIVCLLFACLFTSFK